MVGDERDKGMSSMEDYDDFESGSLGDSASLDGVDDDEDEEDDEEEPKLNFIRIRNDLLGILEKDAVSCVAVHSKVSNEVLNFNELRTFQMRFLRF